MGTEWSMAVGQWKGGAGKKEGGRERGVMHLRLHKICLEKRVVNMKTQSSRR